MLPLSMDKEKMLQDCIDSLFEIDRKIFEAERVQRDLHLAIATIANPGEKLLKKAKEADNLVEKMKADRNFFGNILFQSTGALVVSILE